MSIAINKPDPQKFAEAVMRRQASQKATTLEQVASNLNDYYRGLDIKARRDFINSAVRMYNNYENRWLGESVNGQWVDVPQQGTNNAYFSVPLLTAHVDTHTTFYTKAKPKYIAKPYIDNHLNRELAKMCQEIAQAELDRMLTRPFLQHEAQNMALASVSYRQISMEIQQHSPVAIKTEIATQEVPHLPMQCQDCGNQQMQPMTDPGEGVQPDAPQCENDECMSSNVAPAGEPQMVPTEMATHTAEVLPRPKLLQPNPILVQDSFSAATFKDTPFVITRRKIPRRQAEFYYRIDLSSAFDNSADEVNMQERGARQAVGNQYESSSWITTGFPDYAKAMNEEVEEVMIWLAPCEYGLYFADGSLLATQYPTGLFLHIVGDKLVEARETTIQGEWVRVQQGVRPMSNKGLGMSHVADINDAINNSVSLEYSILRTHGFPIRLLRSRWLSSLPQANQTILMDKIPEDRNMSEAIHTEQPSNTSGTLGILTGRFQGFMQYIGGSLNPTGMSPDTKDIMGSATGASVMQEMMSDRMGLSLQMRVEADFDTMFAVLDLLKSDDRNREVFAEGGYDDAIIEKFFKSNFQSVFYFDVVKGTDEPRLDSVNTFKVQSFAQLTASLTGLRQYDQATFYDIVSALGDTLNIDVTIGAGRKERNLADNRITRIMELYKDQKDLPEAMQMTPVQFGSMLFQAVTMKEKTWLQTVIESQTAGQPPPQNAEEAQLLMAQAQHIAEQIEVYLYDYDALVETYSDWLSSNVGQNAEIAVQVAVGMLYAYCREQQERKKAIAQQEMMQQAVAAMGAKSIGNGQTPNSQGSAANPGDKPHVKRDGSTGPGRPQDPHVTAPSE